jgi:hypothetical protein
MIALPRADTTGLVGLVALQVEATYWQSHL